jgi:prophage tail gpP-like protein
MLKPAYKLTIGREAGASSGLPTSSVGGVLGGGKVIDTTDEPQASTVVDLAVYLGMEAPADSFTLVTGQVGSFRIERDNEVTIELGYEEDDELTQVMVGGIVSVDPGLTTSRATGHSAAQKLLRTFVDKTYEGKTAAQIVRDLSGKAGVDVATADSGITFPAYVVDGRRNVHRHMSDIAAYCGFDLYINSDGELVFEQFTNGDTVHTLEYAKHIVELAVEQNDALAGQVEVFGESPGGGQAEEAWAWLTKDFSSQKGTVGSGDPILLLERPVLRTAVAARTAAEAAHTRIERRSIRGRLMIAGRPQVKLGDAIRLRDVPESALNGTFQVRGVTHRLSKVDGFTTGITFRSV